VGWKKAVPGRQKRRGVKSGRKYCSRRVKQGKLRKEEIGKSSFTIPYGRGKKKGRKKKKRKMRSSKTLTKRENKGREANSISHKLVGGDEGRTEDTYGGDPERRI